MGTKELLDKAMELKPEERVTLVKGLIQSLAKPDKSSMKAGLKKQKIDSGPIGKENSKASRLRKHSRKNDAPHIHQNSEAGMGW